MPRNSKFQKTREQPLRYASGKVPEFLRLPYEIREIIYSYCFRPDVAICATRYDAWEDECFHSYSYMKEGGHQPGKRAWGLLRVNRLIHNEAIQYIHQRVPIMLYMTNGEHQPNAFHKHHPSIIKVVRKKIPRTQILRKIAPFRHFEIRLRIWDHHASKLKKLMSGAIKDYVDLLKRKATLDMKSLRIWIWIAGTGYHSPGYGRSNDRSEHFANVLKPFEQIRGLQDTIVEDPRWHRSSAFDYKPEFDYHRIFREFLKEIDLSTMFEDIENRMRKPVDEELTQDGIEGV